ncbi:structural protein MipA [Shewanella sp. UCD-FRSSP16_17]|uniref:MipA/OmpV family protein n=1 Tax=Shewanella sp. UCD-FRSSP16_17 TaxID=1853256 RepID=UPI0007EED5A4|nr:MipA/OmpV family protein [Shewanella sp. UCD-FRSSP16_17]OBT08925.1 structural protein MipA [Shewanella sp. UCD-FRSSP16_17]
MYRLFFALFVSQFILFPAIADEPCQLDGDCVVVGEWDISVAVGYGNKTNPIANYDDIPLYVIPSIAYYGESWFFDNFNFGYTLTEQETFTINLATSYNDERAFFYRWDPSNIFLPQSANTDPVSSLPNIGGFGVQSVEQPVVLNELESRNFTVYGGAELFWYGQFGVLKIAAAHDLLNVHNGQEVNISWNYSLAVSDWRFDLTLETEWKSAEVIDYYYGIRPSENAYWSEQYQPSSGWNKAIELTTRYRISERWDLLLALRHALLADEIIDSPIINEDYSNSYFAGAAYRF